MYINSMGYYIPEVRIPNEYFIDINGLTPEWIEQRTGIKTRSRVSEGEGIDSMGFDAVDDALKHLPYDIKDVDLIVAAHYCAYDTVATVGHKIQRRHDIAGAKVVYASSACSSFINGMEIIECYFAAGKATKALLICSEQNSYYANEHDPKSGHLWGDAAVAWFFSKEKTAPTDVKVCGIYTEGLAQFGKGPEGVKLRPKEDGISMPDGRDVFLQACKQMIHALEMTLDQTGLRKEDIKKFITHQANKRIVAQVAHMLDKNMEEDFYNNIEELGNTGSASCALVMSQHKDEFAPGEKGAMMVFGGGYSCGCAILEF